jgi:coenzyme F420-reducing hydrogenase delta subunit
MPSSELAHFLRVALEIQATPYDGIHVAEGLMAATDGVMLVAKKYNDPVYLRGRGSLSPKAARVLEALAEGTWIGSIEVNGNRVTVTAQSTRYDEKLGVEVAGEYCEVKLPEFYCRQIPIRRMLGVLTDERQGWVQIVENPRLKIIKDTSVKEYVTLLEPLRDGGELFRLKDIDDEHWYSVAQLRRGLRLFGAKARLSVRRSAKGWLAFEDGHGHAFAVTPFVKQD